MIPYKGEYEKTYYNVKTKSGKIYKCCYPNAGTFWAHNSKGPMFPIPEEDIVEYEVSKVHPLELMRNNKKQ